MKPKYNFFKNASFAVCGVIAMLKNEVAFRLELIFIVPALIISLFLPVDIATHLVLAGVLAIIIIAECVNSAVEACVDLVTNEWHEKAKIAKDCASAAVFFSIVLAVFSWAFVLFKLWQTWQLVD